MRKLLPALLLILLTSTAAQAYTYVDLVDRLTDLESLAVLPEPGEKCAQWSSYHRASYYDEATGKYVGWDKNGDGEGIIRAEGDGSVVAEMEGPGCIWRIWSARPEQGHMRIYLDGSDEPTVDLPFIGYFDRTSEPFTYPALVHLTARGQNNYVPIPYRKSCKIVLDKGWGRFYHFTYSTFPKGTEVPTFSPNLSAEEKTALAKADRFLRLQLGTDPAGHRIGEKIDVCSGSAGPKGGFGMEISGPRAITGLWIKAPTTCLTDEALRNTILEIRWDGEFEPSVSSPLGDFFGTGPGLNRYRSLTMGMTDEGMYSYWYMPFAEKAEIMLVNEGKVPFTGEIIITHAPLTRPIESLGRFHARWHRDEFLPAEPERKIDWTMLKTYGTGRFVGVQLEVWNPRGGWWGEGDEKFFVDGEKFPSTFGTGSEDYFGYAWCSPELFQNAYHNQTRNDGSNTGHISVNRWHIADNVPFMKSFEGAIEKYYPNDKPTLYAATAYWYLAPGEGDRYWPVAAKDRDFYVTPKDLTLRKSPPGALEGESLKILGKTGGDTQVQKVRQGGYSQLWWTHGNVGDKLDLEFTVATSGVHNIRAAMTKARDYGIMQFYLDGQKIGEPLDFYNPEVVVTDEVRLAKTELTAGVHKLTIEIVGANEKALKRHMFGLDYLRVVPAP